MPTWSFTPDEKRQSATRTVSAARARQTRKKQRTNAAKRPAKRPVCRSKPKVTTPVRPVSITKQWKQRLADLPPWQAVPAEWGSLIALLLDLHCLKTLSADSLEIIVDYLKDTKVKQILIDTGAIYVPSPVMDNRLGKLLMEPSWPRPTSRDMYIGKILRYPGGKRKKLRGYVLEYLALSCFKKGKRYTEATVNKRIRKQFVVLGMQTDISTLRRQMIEIGVMARSPDCEWYWLPRTVDRVKAGWNYF